MSSINKILVPCTSRKSDDIGFESSLAQLFFQKLDTKIRKLVDMKHNQYYTMLSDLNHKNNSTSRC
jgi:hypothetical protein